MDAAGDEFPAGVPASRMAADPMLPPAANAALASWSFREDALSRSGAELVSVFRRSSLGNAYATAPTEVSLRVDLVSRFRAALPSAQLAQLLRRSSRLA